MSAFKDSTYKFSTMGATFPLIGINVIMFILQLILKDNFTQLFILNSAEVLTHPWTLITTMFLHADFFHIFFNMYVLLMFGTLIEQRIGTKKFLLVYFLAGLVASLISIPFYTAVLGASGAIMGILGMTIMLMPDLQVLMFFFIPMSLRTAGIIIALIDIFGVFGIGFAGVANWAHLGGLACGLLFGYILIRMNRTAVKVVKVKTSSKKKESDIEMSDEDIDRYLREGRL